MTSPVLLKGKTLPDMPDLTLRVWAAKIKKGETVRFGVHNPEQILIGVVVFAPREGSTAIDACVVVEGSLTPEDRERLKKSLMEWATHQADLMVSWEAHDESRAGSVEAATSRS